MLCSHIRKMTGVLLILPLVALGQENLVSEKPTTPLQAASAALQPAHLDTSFKYQASDSDFWNDFQSDLQDKNLVGAAHNAFAQMKRQKQQDIRGAEAQLALAISLNHLHLPYASFLLGADLAVRFNGTSVGQMALQQLETVVKTMDLANDEIEAILVNHDFSNAHADIQSFLGYTNSQFAIKYGLKKWAVDHAKKINPESFWSQQRQYLTALAQIERGKLAEGRSILEHLKATQGMDAKLLQKSNLQLARLDFEDGKYTEALTQYQQIEGSLREKGKVLIEKAWSEYYLGEYSRALGTLAALDTPFYQVAQHPEAYLIEMLIYRELCQYKLVRQAAQKFRSQYAKTIQAVTARRPLDRDPSLVHFALRSHENHILVSQLDQIQKEQEKLKELGFLERSELVPVRRQYDTKAKLLQSRLDRAMKMDTRDAAEVVLDLSEQIEFLDYYAKLDELRMGATGPVVDYQAESISRVKFSKVFWPVQKEYWFDELSQYQVLVSSQCQNMVGKK